MMPPDGTIVTDGVHGGRGDRFKVYFLPFKVFYRYLKEQGL
jgi:hypothetical protein